MKDAMKMWRRAAFVLIASLVFVACGDDVEPKPNANADANGDVNGDVNGDANAEMQDDIEVVGTWDTQFDSTEVITEESWNSASIVEYDNDENVGILQSPPDDEFTPNQFSRVVWTEPEGDVFYYCTVEFGLETAEEARNSTATADDTDPANGGCNMFAWTMMTRAQ